jgi:hypothetical protein
MPTPTDDKAQHAASFEQLARRPQMGMVGEMLAFLLQNKKWWLIPIIVVLLLLGLVMVLGATGAAPFIYTLF